VQAYPSALSLVACGVYLIVAVCAWQAGRVARERRQQAWHSNTWVLIVAFFLLLIASRLLGLEELIRAELRDVLKAQNLNEDRRTLQGPVIAAVIIVFAASGMLAIYWIAQRLSGRRNIAVAVAIGACGVMSITIAMRTVSLHSLDRLLNGPLKLNWVGDIGASLAVLIAAIIYARIVSGRMDRRR
jgi:succinate dehydrogenase hydrophobic anchor subunit